MALKRNPDLHGNVPEKSPVALLLVDVINDMEFDSGDALVRQAEPVAHRIAALKRRARGAGIPVIYANDNFGRWKSDFRRVVEHCLDDGVRGEPVARLLQPDEDDYFVLKPKHSAFFATSLDTLLSYLGANTLILAGFAGNVCILFTANDAYMRDYHLYVPSDCVASSSTAENEHALAQVAKALKGDTTSSQELDLDAVRMSAARGKEPWAGTNPTKEERAMPRGSKDKYTEKQKRQAEHIEEGYEKRGVGKKEAESRAWATVNAMTGGGKKSGSGRGKEENKEPARKGGRLGGKAAGKKSAKKAARKSAKKAGRKKS